MYCYKASIPQQYNIQVPTVFCCDTTKIHVLYAWIYLKTRNPSWPILITCDFPFPAHLSGASSNHGLSHGAHGFSHHLLPEVTGRRNESLPEDLADDHMARGEEPQRGGSGRTKKHGDVHCSSPKNIWIFCVKHLLYSSEHSVGPRPTRGTPCQQMLGDWTCHGVLILLVVPYSGLNGFNKKLFGDGSRFVDFVHLTLQWLAAFSHKCLGNQFKCHSRIGELIGFASGCDGAVHSMHCAWKSLRRIVWPDTTPESTQAGWITCAFCAACIVTNGQAKLTSSLYDWQTRQDTLQSREAVGLHGLSLWGGIRQPFSSLDILLFLVSDGPKHHFSLVISSSRGRHWPRRLLMICSRCMEVGSRQAPAAIFDVHFTDVEPWWQN